MSAGYTLSETLAAMAVLGLGIGGFSLGMQVIGGQQLAVSGEVAGLQAARAARFALEQALADGAPFRAYQPAQLTGDAAGFRFACGAAACEARLADGAMELSRDGEKARRYRLPSTAPARFVYRGAAGSVGGAWPSAAAGREALRSVSLVQDGADGEAVVFDARVWAEQPRACTFDSVLGDCR